MKVAEVMTRGIEGIQTSESVLNAARRMKELDIGALAVFDGNRVTGIITDRDVAVRVIGSSLNPQTTSVSEVMSRSPKFCNEDEDLDEAAKTMETFHVRRLLVRDAYLQICGMLTVDDIAVRGQEELVPEVIREMKQHYGPQR
jgi:CBS domain-containing protein